MIKKQILYFGKMDLPFNNASACRVMGVCSALQKARFECNAYGFTRSKIFECETDKIKCWNKVYPNTLSGYLKTFGSPKFLKEILSKYDPSRIKAIFLTTLGHKQVRYLGKFCKKNKIPLIHDCGDIIRHSDKNILFKVISYFEFYLFNHYIKKYCSVMAISNYINDFYKGKVTHSFIVPCISDPLSKRFNVAPSSKIDKDKVNFCYFGAPRRDFKKDRLDWCIEAFEQSQIPNSMFYIGGVTQNDLPEKYHNIKNVVYLGRIPNEECVSILKACDFNVFFREDNEITRAGFPSKVTESLMCQTPILTNITSDLRIYLNECNAISTSGYEREDCFSLFNRVKLKSKQDLLALKKSVVQNNGLIDSMWSDCLNKNIQIIEEKINI